MTNEPMSHIVFAQWEIFFCHYLMSAPDSVRLAHPPPGLLPVYFSLWHATYHLKDYITSSQARTYLFDLLSL